MSDDVTRPARGASDGFGRRFLTLLFADLCDSTRLSASVEAEVYGELLAELRSVYEAVIPRHGGTIVRVQGDGLLAAFGHPDPREDDARRATDAALELHAAVRELRLHGGSFGESPDGPALQMHSGIHAGLVLVHEGDALRGRFELLGNIPNIAARLADAAGRDEIVVSEDALGPDLSFFVTRARQLLTLKGWPLPVAAYSVRGRAAVQSRFEARMLRGKHPFVGRQALLEQLGGLLEAVATDRRARQVVVCGAAGLGKTRLIEEFLGRQRAADVPVLRGYCESDLRAEPLQPFVQMLRARVHADPAAALSTVLDPLDQHLAELGAGPVAALVAPRAEGVPARAERAATGAEPTGLQRAVLALVDALAARQPLIVFVDDWHWADLATRQMLAVLRTRADLPLLVILASRDPIAGDPSLTGAEQLGLAPLADGAAAAAIAAQLPKADPFMTERILAQAGGNPLFIEELCHAAARNAAAVRGSRPQAESTSWLEGLIVSRVARLSAEHRRLVQAAAVIGNTVPVWLFEALTQTGVDAEVVQSLLEEDLLYPTEDGAALRFKHGVARDVIYEAIGMHERRAMHDAVAEALRAHHRAGPPDEACEALAYHCGRAGRHEQAAHHAELAGDKALAASALDRAQAQYRAALGAIGGLDPRPEQYPRWMSIAERLGLAGVFDPSRDHLDVFRRAVELASARDDRPAIARAEYWLGYNNYALGESRQAVHHCERALALADGGADDPLVVQIRATLGQAYAAACRYDDALVLLDDALSVKRRHRTGRRPAVGTAYSLACKGSILGDQGRFAEAYACFDEAREVIQGAHHEVEGSVLSWYAGVLLWHGRWDAAEAVAHEARRVAERVKSAYTFAMSQALGAYAGWMQGGADVPPQAHLRALIDATGWLESRDKSLFISLNYGWLADLCAALGRRADTRRYAALAYARARKHDRVGAAMACRALARVDAGVPALAAVPSLPPSPPLLVREPPHPAWQPSLHPSEHPSMQRPPGQPPHRSPAQRLALADRMARLRRSPREWAVNRLCEADLALAAGDPERAAAALQAARQAFAELQMPWHEAQAARRLAELG